ncbi:MULTISPECIES: hypothetical protein [unclassified Ruminococcus]|uniref:hypothetical protein n=1 Tax=unclassified Ruminococcus TaxID=2608920 RepID=UPI002109F22F|nr:MULTISPECIES: hypothetical protein [unclassified Ruminococcus]MCQ4022620.1 hypothetical protein [Ruminococcus sp. zg-924]MCQ4114860.1 hypothetical protein [Ruminococcus sp. zg-921]
MDNNNFPQDPNLNQNNAQQPQEPFQPQPFEQPQPQQPFNPQPDNNNPFAANNGGHNFNTQPNNPFMTSNNGFVPGSDPSAHTKGIISTICGGASILLNLISMIVFCACICNPRSILTYANDVMTGTITSGVLIFLSLVAAVVGLVFAATGKKTSKDPLLTAGIVLSIVGAVLTFLLLVVCVSSCACSSCCVNSAASSSSAYNDLLRSLS